MFVAHFAAGLAVRGRARDLPIAAFVGGAFLLDVLWVAFAVTGIDPTPWSDWSHSLVMALVWSSAFAVLFIKRGRAAVVALWLIAFSHYPLDLLIQGATLYPNELNSPSIPILVTAHAWMLQRVLTSAFLSIFIWDEWRAAELSWRTWAACGLVFALSLR